MHFSQSKSTKCEISAWNCDFSGTIYCKDSKPVALDMACLKPYICTTQAILIHFSQSKSTKCEILAVSLTPPDKKLKKKPINLHGEKVFKKDCKSAHICFWYAILQCTMLELLCDKYLGYYGFSSFFTGRSRYRVLKQGVEVKWDPRRTAAYVPSHFNGF